MADLTLPPFFIFSTTLAVFQESTVILLISFEIGLCFTLDFQMDSRLLLSVTELIGGILPYL